MDEHSKNDLQGINIHNILWVFLAHVEINIFHSKWYCKIHELCYPKLSILKSYPLRA